MLTLLFWMLVGHALADYPLQGDFLSQAKNPVIGYSGFPWKQALVWHAMIHAGAVALVTGSVVLGVLELMAHTLIDYAKCKGYFGCGEGAIHIDQGLHVACKVTWLIVLAVIR